MHLICQGLPVSRGHRLAGSGKLALHRPKQICGQERIVTSAEGLTTAYDEARHLVNSRMNSPSAARHCSILARKTGSATPSPSRIG